MAAPLCSECGFDWRISAEQAVELVRQLPTNGTLLAVEDSAVNEPDRWTPTAYVWHLVDTLRISAERLYSASVNASLPVVPFDQDELAAVRHYESQSAAVGKQSLAWSVEIWLRIAANIDPDTPYRHPEIGDLRVEDALRMVAHEVHHHVADMRGHH